jgi:hypothetical protein
MSGQKQNPSSPSVIMYIHVHVNRAGLAELGGTINHLFPDLVSQNIAEPRASSEADTRGYLGHLDTDKHTSTHQGGCGSS